MRIVSEQDIEMFEEVQETLPQSQYDLGMVRKGYPILFETVASCCMDYYSTSDIGISVG